MASVPGGAVSLRAALYLRLSRDDAGAGESVSIGGQRALLHAYAADHGWTVAGEYVDDGFSGTSFRRPGLQRLLEDVEAGRVDLVLTKDLSRLGRDYIRTGELAGGMVKIVDSITLDEPAELVFHLMAADRPETVGAGMICLTGGRTLEYDPSLTAAIEEIEITDPHIQNGWKRSRLYRISLKTQPVSAGSFAFIIR